jgi:hypothetical protein
MIIRVSTEGQYRVDSSTLEKINQLDDQLMVALQSGDASEFARLLGEMIEVVRSEGRPLPPTEIVESNLVLPPPDTGLEEARRLFPTEGIVAQQ